MEENNIYDTLTAGSTRFLKEYIKDSAFFINRFFTRYTKNNLRATAAKFMASEANIEDYVRSVKSYRPITPDYIYDLYLFYETMINQVPSDKDMILYRGCRTLEDRALDGLSATSLSKNIALNFNRGTLLEIHVPGGSKFIQCGEFLDDEEMQIILPPCDYEIIRERIEVLRGVSTRVVEITITPRDILKDFSLAMENPIYDCANENGIDEEYQKAFFYLYQIMIRRALNNYPKDILKKARACSQDPDFPQSRKGIDAYSDIKLIEFILAMKDLPVDIITAQILEQFPFISQEEKDCLLKIITKFYEKGYPSR